MKGVEGTAFRSQQIALSDPDFAADDFLSLGDRINRKELNNTTSVLSPEEFNFGFVLAGLPADYQPPARLEISLVFENQLDPNGACQSLRPRDSGDG